MSYNGWTNYETWAVKLWMDNEEPSYRYWREVTRDVLDEEPEKYRSHALILADRLKDEHAEALPEVQGFAGFAADLLNAAFGDVDWYEIAESLINDAKEEDTA
jgi:hypothetical protein